MNRFVCVHGHFYQPPRENPWLEAIEQQDSAAPFHDWNARITAECYAPNAHARILDGEGWVVNIVNNYARMSFNMGPTLLSWMADHDPVTYQALLEADRESQARFSGHGAALAQVYNHIILPLACPRDQRTQVRWGRRDFEHRFGRPPEGMWLAETAADLASLQALHDEGITFTILAPGQCRRVRAWTDDGAGDWQDTPGTVDTTRPYWVRLPSGGRIAVFFYDGPVSQSVAFERILDHGDAFAERLLGGVSDDPPRPTLVHIATDGESYGHHHRHGEMGLAYAMHYIERNGLARVTNYGEFLALCPPADEAEIVEPSAWSCAHGVERWKSDCGCCADPGRGWTQAWRRPLREALDWLRDELATVYEAHCAFADPWAARDAYIDVVLDRGDEALRSFLQGQGRPDLEGAALREQLHLLEMQRHAMLMYTSCGWFFDDLSGIETVQIIQYAGRAVQLALPHAPHVEHGFLSRLREAHSNLPHLGDGAAIYDRAVRPAMVDLAKVVAHYAVLSLFEDFGPHTAVYGFDLDREDAAVHTSGRRTLRIGRVRCRVRSTREEATLAYAVLHLGDHNLSGGVRAFQGDAAYAAMKAEVERGFAAGDLAELMRTLDRHFLEMTYSLKSLFNDEQRTVLGTVLDRALEEATQVSTRMHNHHASLIRYVASTGVPLPATVKSAAAFVLNANVQKTLSAERPDVLRLKTLVDEARALSVALDTDDLRQAAQTHVDGVARRLADRAPDAHAFDDVGIALDVLDVLPFDVDVFPLQQAVFAQAKRRRPEMLEQQQERAAAPAWLGDLERVAARLRVRVG